MPRIRKSGDGGLYFDKKRELWIGVVDNGYTAEGKRKQARVTSKSQTIARTKLNKLKQEIDAHGSPLGNRKVATGVKVQNSKRYEYRICLVCEAAYRSRYNALRQLRRLRSASP